jgi:hypothetical protein
MCKITSVECCIKLVNSDNGFVIGLIKQSKGLCKDRQIDCLTSQGLSIEMEITHDTI